MTTSFEQEGRERGYLLALAGEVADGVVGWWMPQRYRDSISRLIGLVKVLRDREAELLAANRKFQAANKINATQLIAENRRADEAEMLLKAAGEMAGRAADLAKSKPRRSDPITVRLRQEPNGKEQSDELLEEVSLSGPTPAAASRNASSDR